MILSLSISITNILSIGNIKGTILPPYFLDKIWVLTECYQSYRINMKNG